MKALRSHGIFLLLSVFVVLYPLSLLLIRSRTGFTSDWYNSLWMADNLGHYYRAHGSLPAILNSNEYVGMTFPIFYGHLLYPFLGFFSAWIGSNWAIRLLCIVIYFIQFGIVYQVFFWKTQRRAISACVSALMLWSIYPLSNLYSRSALPEFIAFSLVISVLGLWFLATGSKAQVDKMVYGFYCAFLFAVMFGVHPITAVYGSFCLLVIALSSVYLVQPKWKQWKWYIGLGFGLLVLTLAFSSSWLDAYLSYAKQINSAVGLGDNTYYSGVDEWWIRLLPFPFDYRSLSGGVSTPTTYLDTQINIPLLILAFFSLWQRVASRKGFQWIQERSVQLGLLSVALSALIFAFSVSQAFVQHLKLLKPLLMYFQIAYRMTNYCNLFILFAVFFLLPEWSTPLGRVSQGLGRLAHEGTVVAAVRAAAVTIAFCSVFAKLFHGSAIWAEASRFGYSRLIDHDPAEFTKIPKSFYSARNYAICSQYTDISPEVLATGKEISFKVASDSHFGTVESVDLQVQAGQWLPTNVYPFPWNEILENGVPVSADRLACSNETGKLSLKATESGRFHFAFLHKPSKHWLGLRCFNQSAFWSVSVFALGLWLYRFRKWILKVL
jgi:hypothetical protein